MALKDKSLILYGIEVTQFNSSIDFRAVSLGPILMGTLNIGFYSLTALSQEIVRALQAADPSTTNVYTVTIDRTVMGGLQNRITIATTGSHLELLFLTGPRTATTVAPLIGFHVLDYTGATTYTGFATAGTALIPTFVGYNYLGPENVRKVFGAVNVSAIGEKEAIVFSIQKFLRVQFKYEPKSFFVSDWLPFVDWAIQQRLFEFTPEIKFPSVFYEVTLESTASDGKGMGWEWKEMIPSYVDLYDGGMISMRQRAITGTFIV